MMMTPSPTSTELEPGELDNAPSFDELAAFIFAQRGEKVLVEVFDGFDAQHPWFADDITAIAEELSARGVDKAAKVMFDLADKYPPLPEPANPFDRSDPDQRGNAVWWEWKRHQAGENRRHPFWLTHISREREKLRQSRSS